MGTNMKVTELDRYLFGQGTHYEIYKLYGRQEQSACLL